MHRIGGIEKEDGTGNISYDPENHEHDDAHPRRQDRRASPTTSRRSSSTTTTAPTLLVLGWGGTWGAIERGGAPGARRAASKVAHAHLVHLNPFPPNLGDVLRRYPKVLVPEMNLGQLSRLVRAEFLVDAQTLTQGAGRAVPAPPRSRARSWR